MGVGCGVRRRLRQFSKGYLRGRASLTLLCLNLRQADRTCTERCFGTNAAAGE